MTTVRVKSFKAQIPRQERSNLGPEYASMCVNVDTSRGLVEAFRRPSMSYSTLAESIRTIFHYQYGENTYWLTWPRVVDVVRSPVPDDTAGRIYYTGDGEPRMTTYSAGASGTGPYPFSAFTLGVTEPRTAPTISAPTGGTVVSRAYVYTFRTALFEESGPSPQTVASGTDGGSWVLSGLDTAPPNAGSVTGVVVAEGIATITLPSTFGLFAGEEVRFSGLAVPELDGVQRLESVGASTVTVKLPGITASGAGGAWERVAKHNTEGMVRCIYRTTGTDTTYRRTDAMVLTDPAATTFTDNVASKDLSIPLETIEVNRPPKNGHSLVILPNNCMAMWAGKELCLSESGKPHSWPTSLRYAQPSDGVALAVAGNGLILLTEDKVRYATVPTAESVSFDNIGTARCASKRGVAPIDGGCIFPAIDGWYAASSSAISKISEGVFRQQEWDDTTPTSQVGVYLDGHYIVAYQDSAGDQKMMRFNVAKRDQVEPIDVVADAMHVSINDGKLYLATGPDVYVWANEAAARLGCSWVSKLFNFPAPLSMSVAKVDAAFDDPFVTQAAEDIAHNEAVLAKPWTARGALGGGSVGAVSVGGSLLRRVDPNSYAQVVFSILNEAGDIVFTKAVTSKEPFRLPGGFKLGACAYGISTNIPVRGFAVSTSMRSLLSDGGLA